MSPALKGKAHYAWKGDAARDETKRERAQKMYPLDGVVCEHEGCEVPATDRHHISGDTGDNRRVNIRLLCRRHHMQEDGRLERFKALVPVPLMPPRPCRICERLVTRTWHGRCGACNEYLRRNGTERPDWLMRGEPMPPQPCVNCSKPDKPLTRGLCCNCYAYLRRRGTMRPAELWA